MWAVAWSSGVSNGGVSAGGPGGSNGGPGVSNGGTPSGALALTKWLGVSNGGVSAGGPGGSNGGAGVSNGGTPSGGPGGSKDMLIGLLMTPPPLHHAPTSSFPRDQHPASANGFC